MLVASSLDRKHEGQGLDAQCLGHMVCRLSRRASLAGALSKANQLPIVGLNYKEVQAQDAPAGRQLTPEEKLRIARERSAVWLQRLGDPYAVSVFDLDGRVGIDYGVYGVPETYIIDKEGVIRFKKVGAVTLETLQSQILPLLQKLNAS